MENTKDHSDNSNKRLFKVDSIDKETIYKVPEGYFDELPGIIQSRVAERMHKKTGWQIILTPATGWKVALATAIITLVLVFSGVFNNQNETTYDQLLADVSLEDLIEYVEYSDISTDEILAEVDLSEYDVEFLMGEDINLLQEDEFKDLDMNDLYEEFGVEEDLF